MHTINYSNTEEVIAFAGKLCQEAGNVGMFMAGCRPTPEVRQIRKIAKDWLSEIDRRIMDMTPCDAFNAIGSYDLIHRIAYGTPADNDYINRHVIKAFDALIRGDEKIDKYTLFRHISTGLKQGDKAYFGRLLQWHSLLLDRWYREFKNDTLPDGLSDYDTLQRLTILLESDLWIFETDNQEDFKEGLFYDYCHYFTKEKIQNIAGDSRTLRVLNHFLTLSLRYLPYEDYESTKHTIAEISPSGL